MILHLASAAHDVAAGGIENTVAGAAGDIHRLQDVIMGAGHLAVAYQEAGCCQRGKTAAYEVSAFLIHALRFFRAGKGLIISV